MSGNVFDVGVDDFDERVLRASFQRPVLVDFWAEWCAPCIVLAPVLEEVVERHQGALRLAKLEVDDGENMRLAGQYRVRGFPTVILFIDGEERARFSSARPAGWIEDWLDQEAGGVLASWDG